MKFYSFISFLTCITAYLLDGKEEDKQIVLYPRPGPIQKYLRQIPFPQNRPIPKPRPITLPEINEDAYFSNNVYDEIEELEEI